MHAEDDFLRKLLESPEDDTVRLVYADWLDELGDDASRMKAAFLRLTVRPPESDLAAGRKQRQKEELQSLAAKLPTDWLAIVSRLKVEGCAAKGAKHRHRRLIDVASFVDVKRLFAFVCDRHWDEMTPTPETSIRRCEQCQQNVHYCDTLTVARDHAERGHCIAVDLGIIRRPDDLQRQMFWTGRPSAEDIRNAELQELDDVSREREERKRQQNAGETSSPDATV